MADLDGLECNKISNCSVLLNQLTESQYGGELTPSVVPLEDEGCCARSESVEELCGEVWSTDGRGDKVILVKEELHEESSSSGISEGEEGIWERSRRMGAEGSSVVDKEAEGSDSGLGSEDLPLPGPPLPVPLARKSTLKRCRLIDPADVAGVKKAKRSIAFGGVSVYYFQRTQGFTCVPSQGGSTLGMQLNHSDRQTFSLTEHVWEQRRAHKQMLAAAAASSTPLTAPTISSSSSSSSDSDTDEHNTESELDPDNYFFLQPVPTRQRRALLRAAGVRKIDSIEKDECRDIRSSREFCGCSCKGFCDPDTCACSQAGIKCQVDRLNFPCGCTHDGCANSNGRIEFNPMRVRTHFIHTMMRIEMEKKREQEEEEARRSELAGFREEASYTNYPFESGYGYSGANPGYQNTHSPPANGYHYEGVPGFHQYESFQGNFRYPEEKVESFSELLQGSRYPQNDLEEIPTGAVPNPDDTNDGGDKSAEENFGEIIKKTMVESVTA